MVFGKGPNMNSPHTGNTGGNMGGDNQGMHPDDRRNLLIFIVISLVVYLSFDHFVLKPKVEAMRVAQDAAITASLNPDIGGVERILPLRPREEIVAEGARAEIDNGAVFGTLALTGNRIDDVRLSHFFKTLGGEDHIEILSPSGTAAARFAEIGWVGEGALAVPDKDTRWRVDGDSLLSQDSPVTMRWDNGQGQAFERVISIDQDFMIQVTQRVVNNGTEDIVLHPYALVAGIGIPDGFKKRGIAHEGPIGYVGDELHEVKYKTLDDKGDQSYNAQKGWIGITEKYFLAAIVPAQGEAAKYRFLTTQARGGEKTRYQTDVLGAGYVIEPGGRIENISHLFVGPKQVRMLDRYEKDLHIPHFDLAVDFGLYYFLTKPFFYVLSFIGMHVGNFGVAIILFTILLRLAMFPLNNTSYRSFAKLKKVAPEMTELREKYGDDKQQLQKELIALYSREKVNPAAGCLPILLQIPIFFALYKVLSVTIEMRHAPFFGWIHDLSVADPTTVFNLFGLLPFTPPSFLMIGAWPCMMLAAMLVQRQMNPPPQDPIQAKMIAFMPYLMTFIMAPFAAGLVIYWTVSNVLSVLQQYIIMRSMGVEVKFFHRSDDEKKLEEQVKHGPDVHPAAEMIEEEVEEALFGDDDAPAKPISAPKKRKKKKR